MHSRALEKKKENTKSPTLIRSVRIMLHIEKVQCNSELSIAHYPVLSKFPYAPPRSPQNGVIPFIVQCIHGDCHIKPSEIVCTTLRSVSNISMLRYPMTRTIKKRNMHAASNK